MNVDNIYFVYHEKGCYIQVIADDEEDAIEKYWDSIESIFSHMEGTCNCFSGDKSFPREKYIQPVRVEKYKSDNT